MDPFHAKVVAAATGSTLTALTMTPFDVVKTRLQTQPAPQLSSKQSCCQPTKAGGVCVRNMSSLARSLPTEIVCVWDHNLFRTERVNGSFDAMRHIWRAEGCRGLWKGAGTSLVIGVPSSTAYILAYDHLLNVVLPSFLPLGPLVPLSAGVLARSAITSIASPLELVRTNLQSTPISPDNPHTLRSVLSSVRSLVNQRGIFFLWRGLGPTLWRDVPFSGIYWASYEAWKTKFTQQGYEGAWVAFISGAVSGTSAALLTSPFDVLKTRRQALLMASSTNHVTSTMQVLIRISQTEGPSALFVGIMPRMTKIAPACGIMIACYEGVGRFLRRD